MSFIIRMPNFDVVKEYSVSRNTSAHIIDFGNRSMCCQLQFYHRGQGIQYPSGSKLGGPQSRFDFILDPQRNWYAVDILLSYHDATAGITLWLL
jgi:hypothetical protein